jgi:hypothetical protein
VTRLDRLLYAAFLLLRQQAYDDDCAELYGAIGRYFSARSQGVDLP